MNKKILIIVLLLTLTLSIFAQNGTVSGVITEGSTPLIGVSLLIGETGEGTITDDDGKYNFSLKPGNYSITANYVGYERISQQVTVTSGGNHVLDFNMVASNFLTEIVITGTRADGRTSTNTTVPVDKINVAIFNRIGGQASVTELLNIVAPSFTSQAQTVSDGTDHIDPAALRGLGPDQVLVLINGKRRHTTSLLNVNGTVGAGSVGTDMNSIPVSSIDRIEVLRDGAAAQYGSDAISGVINIILKDNTDGFKFSATSGANVSSKSNHLEGGLDGLKLDFDANYGVKIKEDGYFHLTANFGLRDPALRNGDYTGDIFNAFHGAERIFDANGGTVANMTLGDYQTAAAGLDYLGADVLNQVAGLDVNNATDVGTLRDLLGVDADDGELAARGLTREDFRFKVGTARLRGGKAFINTAIPVSENTEIYAFGGFGYREGLASGFYRRPAQSDGRANTPAFPNGFLPGIQSDVLDASIAVGVRGKIKKTDWDFSNTFGMNGFDIKVVNSSNNTMGVNTPRDFDAGGFSFKQNTANLDFNRKFEDVLSGLNLAYGTEFRFENFEVVAGEEASWANYDINGDIIDGNTPDELLVRNNFTGSALGGGAQVYRGFTPQNAVDQSRNSVAAYVDAEVDLTSAWLLGVAARFENYSDFGFTHNYKVASRYKIVKNFALRAAFSTGFRAPSLHQKYFSRSSTIFDANGLPVETGTFSNDSQAAQLLGIPELKEETSKSYSVGMTAVIPQAKLSFTLDAYRIDIKDRIVITGNFTATTPELEAIFDTAGASAAKFLTNAINTQSMGIDLVITNKANIGNTSLRSDFAATFFSTKQVGDIKTTPLLESQEGVYFGEQQRLFLEKAQPRTKITLTNVLTWDKMNVLFRNVYYGKVTDPDSFNDDTLLEYAGKLITDLSVGYDFTKTVGLSVGANNLLDIYPDVNRPASTSGSQFTYSRRTSQFGYSGRFLFLKLNLSL